MRGFRPGTGVAREARGEVGGGMCGEGGKGGSALWLVRQHFVLDERRKEVRRVAVHAEADER